MSDEHPSNHQPSFIPLADFLDELAQTHPKPREVEQRFLDEINKYGRIVSVEEFLKDAKEGINDNT